MAQIADLLDILAKPARVTHDHPRRADRDPRRSSATSARAARSSRRASTCRIEDLIAPEDMVVTLSHGGYMKASRSPSTARSGAAAAASRRRRPRKTISIDQLFIANTHDYILCFSNRGRVYWLKVYEVPQGSRDSRGKPIVNLFPLSDGEKINVDAAGQASSRDGPLRVHGDRAWARSRRRRSPSSRDPRQAGIIAVDLDEGDCLIGAALTDGKHDVMLFSDGGKAVRFDENDVRPMGRNARGVRGMMLDEGQSVIAHAGRRGRDAVACSPPPRTATASARRSPSTRATAAAPRA